MAIAALVLALLAIVPAGPARAAAGDITTYAGSLGEGPGVEVAQRVRAMAARGSLVYMGDEAKHVVRVLDTATGLQRIVAGNGTYDGGGPGSLGDGAAATSATLGYISGLAFDAAGNLFIADSFHFRIRKMDPSGRITIVAGNGTEGDGGDGGPARSASLRYMWGLEFDAAGNLYVSTNTRIRKIDTSGTITTVVGKGPVDVAAGSSPDGTPATEAQLNNHGFAVDADGTLYFSDGFPGARIRRVDGSGLMATFAYTCAYDLVFDAAKNLYGAGCDSVKKLDPTGRVWPVPTGGVALQAPNDLAIDGAGNLYVSEVNGYRVRRIDPAGSMTTVAGNGTFSFGGDGGPATRAQLYSVSDVARDSAGNVYIADWGNKRIRRVDPTGTITTFAGNGTDASTGDGGPAAAAAIGYPSNVTVDPAGNVYIASYLGFRVRKVDTNGIISTVAGNGTKGYTGDGGPATAASIGYTSGLAVDGAGNVYIADNGAHRVRKVAASGAISTVAGTGTLGFAGDGGLATAAQLHYPNGLAVDAQGNLFIADTYNGRARKVAPDGTISTFAHLGFMLALTSDGAGGLFVGGYGEVHRVTPQGTVKVAGTGVEGWSGDGGPALNAQFEGITGLAFDGTDLFIGDALNARIRRVASAGSVGPATTTTSSSTTTTTRAPTTTTTTTTPPSPAGTVRSWGLNHVGQVGTGTFTDSARLTTPAPLGPAKGVAAGFYHSLAIGPDGTVDAWGWNHFGQLGDWTTADRPTPVRVPNLSGAVAVAGGATHSLAVKDDGTVWAWGFNGVGQLGTGTTTDSLARVQVPGLSNVKAIAAGAFHSLALNHDGTVWAWGWNGFGALGDGTTTDRWAPKAVPGLTGVTSIAAGAYHSLVATGNGTVYSWGWNALGQLGNGTTANSFVPVRVNGLGAITAVSGGMAHSLALGVAGEVYAWGWNALGQLGGGNQLDARTPVKMMAGGVRDIAAGGYHSAVATTGGAVMAWGWNAFGQGPGGATLQLRPAAAPGVSGVTDVAAGVAHTLAR